MMTMINNIKHKYNIKCSLTHILYILYIMKLSEEEED